MKLKPILIFLLLNSCYLIYGQTHGIVTVNGSIVNDGNLNLRSDASGCASLIALVGSTGSGTTTAERYLTGAVTGGFWHNCSSPVSGQKIQNLIHRTSNNIPLKFVNPDTIYGGEYYDESLNSWLLFKNTTLNISNLNFTPGIGYLLRRAANGNIIFTGSLNAGTLSPSVSKSAGGIGWNSVGNPYSSSIGINTGTTATDFLTYNLSNSKINPSYAAAYFWSGTSYSVIINNSSAPTYIQPGQGFMVKVSGSAANVDFTPAMQTHYSPSFYKKSSLNAWNELILSVNNDSDSSSTKILFRDDMTRGLDISYDAGIFVNNSDFSLYSKLADDNGVNFAIQCLSDQETDPLSIPVGFDCTSGGLVTFKANISTLPSGYIAILEDRLLGKYSDLAIKNAEYEIAIPQGTSGTGRFYLHLVSDSNGLNQDKGISIYSIKKEIFIAGTITSDGMVSVYDLTGRKIAVFRLEDSEMNILNVSLLKNGIYILKITDKGILKTERVFISE